MVGHPVAETFFDLLVRRLVKGTVASEKCSRLLLHVSPVRQKPSFVTPEGAHAKGNRGKVHDPAPFLFRIQDKTQLEQQWQHVFLVLGEGVHWHILTTNGKTTMTQTIAQRRNGQQADLWRKRPQSGGHPAKQGP